MSGEFILAQLSDTHVTAAPRPDGLDAVLLMRRALAQAEQYRPDAVLITGDIVNDARTDEYATLAEVLRGVNRPLYLLPGNHDDRVLMRAALPDHAYWSGASHLSYVVDLHPVRLICLDQTVPGAVYGDVTPELADWLDTALSRAPRKPTILALHHPPFLTHDLLFDRIGLQNADRFTAIVAKHPQVMRIICGHHHRSVIGQVAHAPVVCAPSTAWGFSLALHEGQEIARRCPEPGFALHVWREGAGLATHIVPFNG